MVITVKETKAEAEADVAAMTMIASHAAQAAGVKLRRLTVQKGKTHSDRQVMTLARVAMTTRKIRAATRLTDSQIWMERQLV